MVSGLTGDRLRFLRALVHAGRYRTDTGIDPRGVIISLSIDLNDQRPLESFLIDRGLIRRFTIARVCLERRGIDVIEQLEAEEKTQAEETNNVTEPNPDPRKVFIIHGRNMEAYNAVRDFVRALGLQASDFQKMVEAAGTAPYIGEVIAKGMKEMRAVVAVFTPDERAMLREKYHGEHDRDGDRERWQARPNVIFEAGMAMGIAEKRTILLTLGRVSLSSDIDGRHILRMSDSIEARDAFKGKLRAAGCDLSGEQSDWTRAGHFNAAVEGLSYEGSAPAEIQAARANAPDLDIRVLASAVIVGHPPNVSSMVAIEIQNHSASDFHFAGIWFPLSTGEKLAVVYDSVTSEPLFPRKVGPGDGFSICVDPGSWELNGRTVNGVVVRDKIDRKYSGDPLEVSSALSDWQANAQTLARRTGR